MQYIYKTVATVATMVVLGGCSALPFKSTASEDSQHAVVHVQKMFAGVHFDRFLKVADGKDRRVVAQGIKALMEGNLPEASKIFNIALKLNVTNSDIHTLNALTFHLMALSGDTLKYEMAEEGYRVALRMDPANWLAEYQLGLCFLDQRKYQQAKINLSNAALIERNNPQILLDLAAASYYSGDPRVAEGVLKRVAQIAPELARKPNYLRAVALTQAALNDADGVKSALADYRAVADSSEMEKLASRAEDWNAYYRTVLPAKDSLKLAGLASLKMVGLAEDQSDWENAIQWENDGNTVNDANPWGGDNSGLNSVPQPVNDVPEEMVNEKMVVVDVVLISTQEDATETYGVNLLKGLSLQYGNAYTPAWDSLSNKVTVVDPTQFNPAYSAVTNTITRSMSIPSINYSLNIANAVNAHDEIIAKPSLIALSGQLSEFFSGSEISAAAVSGGAGDSVSIQKEIGVKLSVKPDFLPNGKVRLQIAAQRTFLTTPSTSVVFQFRLDTSKTTLNSNVVMNLGDTLVLGGLMESEDSKNMDGVPILRDIPGLNFLFSTRSKLSFRKSVIILLTPRSPIYSARSENNRKIDFDRMNDYEKSVSQLETRNSDWFRPHSVTDEAREKLSKGDFTRQIHLGDVQFEHWEKRPVHAEVVNKVLDRLSI